MDGRPRRLIDKAAVGSSLIIASRTATRISIAASDGPHASDEREKRRTMNEPLAYSVKEVAVMLGLSQWKVRELCYTQKLRSLKAGKRLLISRAALHAFLNPDLPADTDASPLDQ